jgi:hypothetical protein
METNDKVDLMAAVLLSGIIAANPLMMGDTVQQWTEISTVNCVLLAQRIIQARKDLNSKPAKNG